MAPDLRARSGFNEFLDSLPVFAKKAECYIKNKQCKGYNKFKFG